MKGYKVGSQWLWKRIDGHLTQVTVVKSLKTCIHLRANISGWRWSTSSWKRLTKVVNDGTVD